MKSRIPMCFTGGKIHPERCGVAHIICWVVLSAICWLAAAHANDDKSAQYFCKTTFEGAPKKEGQFGQFEFSVQGIRKSFQTIDFGVYELFDDGPVISTG